MTFNISYYLSENLKNFSKFDEGRLANKGLLAIDNGVIGYDDIDTAKIKDGVSIYQIAGIQFHCFTKLKEGQSKKIYVLLSGGRTPSKNGFSDTLPRFKRWSFYTAFDGNVLVFDDPMYFNHPKLAVGWFFGTKQCSYIDLLVKVVSKIALALNCTDICFYGSSSGGFASLCAAAKLNKSRGIAINPQLLLKNDWYATRFKEITNIDLSDNDEYYRNDLNYLVANSDSKFVIIQNLTDAKTVREHFIPFCRNMGLWPKYGLSEFQNVKTFVYNCQGGHVAYENKKLLPFLLRLAYPEFNNEQIYISLSDIWSDYKK